MKSQSTSTVITENLNAIGNSMKDKYESVEESALKAKVQISNATEELAEQTKKMADASIEVAKKYPLHTAVGAAAIGFAVGLFLNRKK
jgi:ElaB/YqjD/DUF883 family membrane-anchored ribosome-binding protein